MTSAVNRLHRTVLTLWDRACGVHSTHHATAMFSQDVSLPANPVGRIISGAVRRLPRVAMLFSVLIGGALMLVAPMGVATGSVNANADDALFDMCSVAPWTIGQGPSTSFDGPSALIPRANLAYANLTADSSLDLEAWSDAETAKEVATTVPGVGYSSASARTSYELFGTGMNFTVVGFDPQGAGRCDLLNTMMGFSANAVFWLPRMVTDFTIKMKQFATGASPLAAVYESPGIAGDTGDANGAAATNDGIISTLRDTVFYGALTVGFLSLGFWILFQGERGGEAGSGQRTIVAGITWSVCWALFVAALLVNQHWWTLTKATDTGISQINSQLANAMFDQGGGSAPCALPSDAPNRGLRLADCALYNTVLFQPWAVGEFGTAGATTIPVTGNADDDSPMSMRQAHPSWQEAYSGRNAVSFWQWAGCNSVDKQGYTITTDTGWWWWSSDSTKKVIGPDACFMGGGLQNGYADGCTIQSAMGAAACADVRLAMLSIIGSNPQDYVAMGDPVQTRTYLQAAIQTNPVLAPVFTSLLATLQGLPVDIAAIAGATPMKAMETLKTSSQAQRQLIAFTNYLGAGTTLDTTIRGENGMNRIGMAFMALIMSLVLLVLIGYMALMVLMWHGVSLVMIVLLPIVGAFAINPAARKLAEWWMREFVGAFALRFMYGLAITISIALFQSTMNVPGLALGLKLLLLFLMTAAVWTLIKEIRSGALTPTLGGDKAAMGNKFGTATMVSGAALGYAAVKATRPARRASSRGMKNVGRAAFR